MVTWFIASRAGLTVEGLRAYDLSAWTLRWPTLLFGSTLLLAGYVLNGALWGRIVRDLGGPSLPTWVAIRLHVIASMGRYVPGKVWQIAGLTAMARRYEVAAPTAAAAAIIATGVGLASAAAIGLGAIWSIAGGQAWRWIAPALLAVGIGCALAPPVFRRITDAWFRLAKTQRPERLDTSHARGWILIGAGIWLVYAGAFWLFVTGLGFDVSPIPTASAFAAAYALGYVMVFAPAGIGVREGFLVALLSPQMGAAAAGAVALITRLWMTLLEVVPAAAFWARHLATVPGASKST